MSSMTRISNKARAGAFSLTSPSAGWAPGDQTIFEMELSAPLPRGFLAQRATLYRLELAGGASVEIEARSYKLASQRVHPNGLACARVRFYRTGKSALWVIPEKDA